MNRLYPAYRESCLTDPPNLSAVDVRALALTSGYTFNEAHDHLDDVPGGGVRLSTTAPLDRIVVGNGVYDAADAVLPAVPDQETIARLVLYVDTGTESTSMLVAYMDENADSTPMALVGEGADVLIRWSNLATRIFKL